MPIAENVVKYAVKLTSYTRPDKDNPIDFIKTWVKWGAGPRASQYLILGSKINALLAGKYSPDIEDVQHVANWVLAHRFVKNYKAEAESISTQHIISKLL